MQEEGREIIATVRKVFGHKSARDNDNARGLMTMRGWCMESGETWSYEGKQFVGAERQVDARNLSLNEAKQVSRLSRLLVCSKQTSSIVAPANSA